MRIVGWLMTTAGLLLALIGIGMGIAPPGAQTVNIGIMSERATCMSAAAMLFIPGVVLIAAGQLRAAIADPLERAARHLEALDTRARNAAGAPGVGKGQT